MSMLPVSYFCSKWNLHIKNVYVLNAQKKRPWYHNGLVDEKRLLKIKADRIRYTNLAQEYYWQLKEQMSINKLAKRLSEHSNRSAHSWVQYLEVRLFVNFEDYSIVKDNMPKMLMEFLDIVENYLLKPEPDINDFDKIEDYYGYYEALKLRMSLQKETPQLAKA